MLFKNRETKTTFIGAVVLIMFISFLLTWFYTRAKPFPMTIMTYFIVLLALAIIGGVVALVLWLFQKQKIDLLFVAKTKIINTCKLTSPTLPVTIELYDNISSKPIGTYQGCSMIKTADVFRTFSKKDKEVLDLLKKTMETKSPKAKNKYRQETMYIIAFKPYNSRETELILCTRNDFNSLESSPVIVYDIGFAPQIFEFYILAKYYDVAQYIEIPIKTLIDKYTMENFMRDQVSVFDNAIDLDASFRKTQEKSNIDEYRGSDKDGRK